MNLGEDERQLLGERFQDALQYATQLHARQLRKGTQIPYIAHLLSVTALVLESGGNEDEAIAALLHDSAEDQGGYETLDAIRERYGVRVAAIVEACSDSFDTPKPPWAERKQRYLVHLEEADEGMRRVSLADKTHNVRDILLNYRTDGEQIWERFKGGREGTLWYYRSLADIFCAKGDSPLTEEFCRLVAELIRLTGDHV